MMIICKHCGVELESDMLFCPLCKNQVKMDDLTSPVDQEIHGFIKKSEPETRAERTQRRFIWELISIILVLIIIVASLLNYILNREISWSEYPIAICLILFSYVSVLAFMKKNRIIQIISSFVIASLLILAFDQLTDGLKWSLQLGIPLLFFLNIVIASFLIIAKMLKQKGINLIAYAFLATALLCIFVEGTIDLYINVDINLVWSLIVCACVFPVVAILLYMHFRMKAGSDLGKTFHI
jgi:hypothetical protein